VSQYDHDPRFVCADCFGDQGIKGFIESYAKSNECSFCGAAADDAIAAPF